MIHKKSFALLFFLTVFLNAETIFCEQRNNSDNNTESVLTPAISGNFSINLTDRVERVFSYRLSDGTLRFTNSFNDIPREYAGAIESVSEFPVMCIQYFFLDGRLIMTLNDGGRKVAMAGVFFEGEVSRTRAEEYLKENIAGRKLRVRYSPQEESDLYLNGLFYLREGNFINLEMVNRGIGKVDPKTVPSHLLSSFMPDKKGQIIATETEKQTPVIPEKPSLAAVDKPLLRDDIVSEQEAVDQKKVSLKKSASEDSSVVDVSNFNIVRLEPDNRFEISFVLVNKTEDKSPVSGYVFALAVDKSEENRFYALWPPAEHASGVPNDYKQGSPFSIRSFLGKKGQILRPSKSEQFDHVEIIVYSENGEIILKKEFETDNE